MAFDKPIVVDDDGSGTTGTILDAAWFDDFGDRIDDAIDGADAAVRSVALGGTGASTLTSKGVLYGNGTSAVGVTAVGTSGHVLTSNGAGNAPTFQAAAGGTIDVGVCEGRLTLTSGTPVTTSDVTAATNVYWTPYKGKYVALYDGASAWVMRAFVETTLALGTVTSGLPYDIFAYDNAGTLALEKLAWTNGTTRATALTLQDGVLVKTGATTRRYLGTIYTTSTTTTEDSLLNRFVWNYYNRRPRHLLRRETTSTWTYTTATWRQANASASNQVALVIGVDDSLVSILARGMAWSVSSGVVLGCGVGVDSTTTPSTSMVGGSGATTPGSVYMPLIGKGELSLAVGYHYLALLEYSAASGTTNWLGAGNLLANMVEAGISAQVMG